MSAEENPDQASQEGACPLAANPVDTVVDRGTARSRVLKSGTIAFGGRQSTLPCTVRDISATGARLRTENPLIVPDTFELLIDLDGLEADCKVIWRRNAEVGVKFIGEPRKAAPKRRQTVIATTPHMRPSLRRKAIATD